MRFINAAIFLAAAGSAVAIPFGNTGYPQPPTPAAGPLVDVDVQDNEILSENFSENFSNNDIDIEVIKKEIETRDLEHLEEFAKFVSVPETETTTRRRRQDDEDAEAVHDEDEDPEVVPAPPTPENDEETETHDVERRGDVEVPSVPEHDHDEIAQHDFEPHVEKVVRGVIVTVIELKVLILRDLSIICKFSLSFPWRMMRI